MLWFVVLRCVALCCVVLCCVVFYVFVYQSKIYNRTYSLDDTTRKMRMHCSPVALPNDIKNLNENNERARVLQQKLQAKKRNEMILRRRGNFPEML